MLADPPAAVEMMSAKRVGREEDEKGNDLTSQDTSAGASDVLTRAKDSVQNFQDVRDRAADESSTQITSRDHRVAYLISELLDSTAWRIASPASIAIALFALDFTVAFLPKTVDQSTSMIIFISFLFLLVEIILTSVAKKNYLGSFFFWLDVVGTVSMTVDIPWMLGSQDSDGGTTNDLSVARASRVSRIARSAGTFRIARLFRVFRIMRVVRVFTLFDKKREEDTENEFTNRRPSKIGLKMVDLISKRVIGMVLLLMIVLPFLDTTPVDNFEGQSIGLIMMDTLSNQTDLNLTLFAYQNTYSNTLLYLKVQDNVYIPFSDEISDLRTNEINKFISLKDGRPRTEAWFSYRAHTYEAAGFNMALTLIIVAMFVVGTVWMTHDARVLIVEPIERMTTIVRKLAGTVCLLSTGAGPDAAEADNTGMEDNEYETAVIESLVDKMADIFQVHGQGTAPVGANEESSVDDLVALDSSTDAGSDEAISRSDIDRGTGIEKREERGLIVMFVTLQYPALHWTETRKRYLQRKAEYDAQEATVFDDTHPFEIFAVIILRNYRHLAEHYVDRSGHYNTIEEKEHMLKRRLRHCTHGPFARRQKV